LTLAAPLIALAEESAATGGTLADAVNDGFGSVVGALGGFLFWSPPFVPIPLIVMVLVFGAGFYTVFHGFMNFRGFKHAIDVTRGKYDNPDDPGEISHFQALTAALSATVGLGNIAGVAVAVGLGGPGAVFWMMVFGLVGMSAKLHECTLAQIYRRIEPDGTVNGGPMYYLEVGLAQGGMAALGKALAVIFAVFCVLGSVGGGNMFQANQAYAAIATQIDFGNSAAIPWVFGFVLAFLVGLVIIGGIKSIGRVTERIIPLMVVIYLVAGAVVIVTHLDGVPRAFSLIFTEAFSPDAFFYGGFIAVLVQGVRRAVFSNEAGIGSAAIAHSAAKTDEPVREGMVAMLGPFIDTVVICAMTATLLIVSGAHEHRAAVESQPGPYTLAAGQTIDVEVMKKKVVHTVTITLDAETTKDKVADLGETTPEELAAILSEPGELKAKVRDGRVWLVAAENDHLHVKGGTAAAALGFPNELVKGAGAGVLMTRWAFADSMSWFPWVLAISILLFAYSTMISWSYYGEKAWTYLFGRNPRQTMIYRVLFLLFVVLGTVSSLENVIGFSDLMILSMAFPNIIGGLLLAKIVRERINDYWARYNNDEFKVYK